MQPDLKIADSILMETLPGNVSKGITEEGYGYFALPTPGEENTNAYFTEIDSSISFLHTDLYFSEVASSRIHSSRAWGKPMYEYIEIYNDSNEYMDLAGYTIAEDEQSYYSYNFV